MDSWIENLTIIEDTLARIYLVRNQNIDLKAIPMDDKEAYALMARGDTVGVFQLESAGMQRYLKQLKPTQFEDIIAMVALYRPGPMQFIPDFIDGKNGLKTPVYLHPKLESILGPTYGIILYQEQTMKIAQELAGFSMAEADTLRKAIGKKIKDLMMASKQKFIDGCQKTASPRKSPPRFGVGLSPARIILSTSRTRPAYAMIAYQTAYLKAHYPAEFMAALITSEKKRRGTGGLSDRRMQKYGIGSAGARHQ